MYSKPAEYEVLLSAFIPIRKSRSQSETQGIQEHEMKPLELGKIYIYIYRYVYIYIRKYGVKVETVYYGNTRQTQKIEASFKLIFFPTEIFTATDQNQLF